MMTLRGPELEDRTLKPSSAIKIIVLLCSLLVLLIAGFFIQKGLMDRKVEAAYQQGRDEVDHVEYVEVPVEREVTIPIEVRTVITAEMITDGLNDIGELVTQEYYYTEVGSFENSQMTSLFGYSFTLPGTRSSYIYSYDGIIKAGIDFTGVEIVKDDGKMEITATLPRSKITSHEFVDGSFELYDEKTSVFNPVSIRDFDLSNSQLKTSAEKKAINKGLLTKADSNAEYMIKSFIRSGFDLGSYKITVKWK